MLEAVGYRVLIDVEDVEETSEGGIVVITEATRALEENAQQIGTVRSIGPDCWKEYEKPWVKVGDKVIFAKYSGRNINDPTTGETLSVMNDTDILGVIKNG